MDTAFPSIPPSAADTPNPPADRFDSVDLIRGVAVCGILLMNIVSFAMPTAAYLNPEAYMGDLASSHLVYAFTHVFADQKFMGLFSLLFGSSVLLFINKLKSRGANYTRLYYSRTTWLLVFGFLHSLLLWEGDILFYYALCGFFLYPFWRLAAGLQFTLGLIVFLSAIAIDQVGQSFIESLSTFSLNALEASWSPGDLDVAFETATRLDGYARHLAHRNPLPGYYSEHYLSFLSTIYVGQGLARAFGLMLIGMAFYSWGIVTAQRSSCFYRRLASGGFALGLPIVAFGLWRHYVHNWDITYGLFAGSVYNHVATPLLVFAYLSLILAIHRQGRLSRLRSGLCAVGRMAFTNYIGQSLIATFLFYGYGLGLFGQLNRLELLAPVLVIWTFQFYFSLWWMRHFRYGPLEWLWRTLTYFHLARLRA